MSKIPVVSVACCFLLGLSALAETPRLVGKTETEILTEYGSPQTVMDLGNTKVLGYQNMLIELEDGKVTKVGAVPPSFPSVASSKLAPSKSESQENPVQTSAKAEIGQTFELKFTSLTGDVVDLELWKGKVVLIDFWATWCGPCVMSIPRLLEAYKKYHPEGLEVIGISLDTEKSKLLEFIEKNQVPWPQFFDGKGWENEVARKQGVQSIPALWLIDKKGQLVSKDIRGSLDKSIKKALSE